jgi:hypothetical protein
MIVTGQGIDFACHCKYEFGKYVQTHEEHNNDMAPWTVGALACALLGMLKVAGILTASRLDAF